MTQRRDAYVEGSCDGYSRGFAAGHAHAREQVAAQLEDRADGLTGERVNSVCKEGVAYNLALDHACAAIQSVEKQ